MKIINFKAIYVMWLREMKRFMRAKSRIIGTLIMPLFFLAFLGFGFGATKVAGIPEGVSYIQFLIPGILGMNLLFGSTFAGLSVLWDRELGFLKEVMVAPVHRVSVLFGRIAGGITTGIIQAVMILFISILGGFKIPGVFQFLLALAFMILIASTFIGMGLVFASNMKDPQGFNLIVNFLVFPLFLLSGALYPISNLPSFVRVLSYIDPLTFGVDGMRFALLGSSNFNVFTDLAAIAGYALLMIVLGTYFFSKSESV